MRILLAAPNDAHTGLYLKRAFESLGHEVEAFDYREYGDEYSNAELRMRAKEAGLTLVLKGETITPDTLSNIHPCALWNFDLWYCTAPWLLAQVESVDHFFTPSKLLFPNSSYLPEAADLELHRPGGYDKEYAADVTFIGTVKDVPGRDEWLEEIGLWCDKNKKVLKIWGSFPGEKSKKWHQERRAGEPRKAPYADNLFAMNEDVMHNIIVSSSKIVLDRQRNPEIEGAVSARVFRTMAAKGLVLMRQTKGQEELLGLRNGWNCLTFEKDEETVPLIEAALGAEERYKSSDIVRAQNLTVDERGVFNERGIQVDERAVIARHGYETVVARHTWQVRAKTILEHMRL